MGWCNGSCHNVACDGQNLHPMDAMAWHHVLRKTYWVMCLHDNYTDVSVLVRGKLHKQCTVETVNGKGDENEGGRLW